MEIAYLRNIERVTLYLVPLAGLLGLIFGIQAGVGALVGAGVTAANFAGIRRIAEKLQTATQKQQRRLLAMLALKFGALLVGVGLIIRFVPLDRIAFLFGFSSFLIAIAVESARRLLAEDSSEAI